LLDVLAVVAFGAGQAEEALLEDRVLLVPEGEREAQARLAVADPEQPVLVPAVGAAPRVVVGQVRPGVALGRVVLAHGAPLPLGQVRPPALPVPLAPAVLVQSGLLGPARAVGRSAPLVHASSV